MRQSQFQGKSFLLFSQTGCLLPLLIALNLFFGRIFFSFWVWLFTGVVLALLFLRNISLATQKIVQEAKRHSRGEVIDVEAKVVRTDKQHKAIDPPKHS